MTGPESGAEPGHAAFLLPDDRATEALGRRIGQELAPGDLVTLSGGIGAGKTTLARAILRELAGDPELEAPSPTFTLTQTYEGPAGPVLHADLYRVAGEGELVELGFEEWFEGGIVLVEWPDRAPSLMSMPRLDVTLDLDPATGGRLVTFGGSGPLLARVRRARAIDALLERAGWAKAERRFMQGDASARAYERLHKPSGETAVLMISPPRPDGPAVRRGRPYSAIARLAESIHAFVAIDRGLAGQGVSVPAILAEDLETGLLLIEDLGQEPVVGPEGPIPDRYAEAARLLAFLHGRELPVSLPVGGQEYGVPPYDLDAFQIEAELLLDWYMPHLLGIQPSGSVRAEFGHVWRETLAPLLEGPKTWVLRDYHSPNLIWLPQRQGLDRVGVIDFQDAVLGPPAYDVASLLQDARVTVAPELELRLLGLYAGERRRADPDFDMAGFATAYAIMGAQRATKILGIFARLDLRDGKPHYLAHLPRIRSYLARNLAHPELARLRGWYATHLKGHVLDDEPEPEGVPPEDPPGEGEA